MFLLWFTLYRTLCASWTWVCFLQQDRENLSHYFFKWVFIISPSFPWISIMWMLLCLILSTKCIKLSSTFWLIYLFFWCSNWVISTTVYFSWLICPSESPNLLIHLLYFSSQLLYSALIISSFFILITSLWRFILHSFIFPEMSNIFYLLISWVHWVLLCHLLSLVAYSWGCILLLVCGLPTNHCGMMEHRL